LSEFHVEVLNPTEFVPAPAQGVLGLQIREDDAEMKENSRRKIKPNRIPLLVFLFL
jgi:porphobilinogen deaminase